jgi:flagellar basal-body rod protein FlgC
MKPAVAMILALAILTFTVIEAEAANDPHAIQKIANPAAFPCADLQKAALKLPVYVSNIENKDTTRTPEGGPYKRIDIVCHELYCDQVAHSDFKLMVAPTHPDANGAGYVQVPRIDVATQFAGLTSAAAEVRLLAEAGTCGATALGSSTMALIKYPAKNSIQSDTFAYASDGHLTTWTRLLQDGTSKSFAFAADGTVLKQ